MKGKDDLAVLGKPDTLTREEVMACREAAPSVHVVARERSEGGWE